MKFRYINSRGEILDMSEFPYLFQSGDLLNYSWSYDTSNNRITNVRRQANERLRSGSFPTGPCLMRKKERH